MGRASNYQYLQTVFHKNRDIYTIFHRSVVDSLKMYELTTPSDAISIDVIKKKQKKTFAVQIAEQKKLSQNDVLKAIGESSMANISVLIIRKQSKALNSDFKTKAVPICMLIFMHDTLEHITNLKSVSRTYETERVLTVL